MRHRRQSLPAGSAMPPTPPLAASELTVAVPLDPYLSLRALAGYCGLSVRTLRSFISDDVRPLPCYRVCGKVLVRLSEFDTWMTAYRTRGHVDVDRVVDEVLRNFR